jgi:peroxiredoxin
MKQAPTDFVGASCYNKPMKRLAFALLCLAGYPHGAIPAQSGLMRYPAVALDSPVPDVALREMKTGKTVKLSDYRGKTLVGIFMAGWCNNTWKHDRRIEKLVADYKPKGIEFVAIHATLHELDQDLLDKAESRGLNLPMLDDKPRHELLQKIDAPCSPTFFVLDRNGVLRYKGGFDNNRDPQPVPYLRPVLEALLASKPLPYKQTTAYGCSLRRKV